MAFSSNEMYTTEAYLSRNPTWDDEGAAWKAGIILDLLKKNNIKRDTIVEVGCGAGGILSRLAELEPSVTSLVGYDISPFAIKLAEQKANDRINFYEADFINMDTPGGDVLLVIDVIEHIDDYYGFMNKLKGRAEHVVFHIPLDLSCRNILKPHTLLLQRDLVGHLHYFTKEMVQWMLKETGFTIVDWLYTKPTIDTGMPQSLKAIIKKNLRSLSFRINPDLSARLWGGYSMMVLAK